MQISKVPFRVRGAVTVRTNVNKFGYRWYVAVVGVVYGRTSRIVDCPSGWSENHVGILLPIIGDFMLVSITTED